MQYYVPQPQLASSRTDPANSGCSDPARSCSDLRAGTAGPASRPIVLFPRRTRPDGRVAAAPRPLDFWTCRDRRTGCTPAGQQPRHRHMQRHPASGKQGRCRARSASADRHPPRLPFSNEWLHLRPSCRWFSGDLRKIAFSCKWGRKRQEAEITEQISAFAWNSFFFASRYIL